MNADSINIKQTEFIAQQLYTCASNIHMSNHRAEARSHYHRINMNRRPVCLRKKGAVLIPRFFTIFGLVVNLTFDLLTSKSNQFIFVPNCTSVANLVKLPRAVCKICCPQTFSVYDHRRTHARGQPKNISLPGLIAGEGTETCQRRQFSVRVMQRGLGDRQAVCPSVRQTRGL